MNNIYIFKNHSVVLLDDIIAAHIAEDNLASEMIIRYSNENAPSCVIRFPKDCKEIYEFFLALKKFNNDFVLVEGASKVIPKACVDMTQVRAMYFQKSGNYKALCFIFKHFMWGLNLNDMEEKAIISSMALYQGILMGINEKRNRENKL